jgi:hypothetical protein
MEQVDLGKVIQDAIARFSQNRIGKKPPVSIRISAALPTTPWTDGSLRRIVKALLYEALMSNDPEAPTDVCLRRRSELKEFDAFVQGHPLYWAQIRVAGRGLRLRDLSFEEILNELGYLSEEWFGIKHTTTQFAVFVRADHPEQKLIFCTDPGSTIKKYDLLLPITKLSMAAHPLPKWQLAETRL